MRSGDHGEASSSAANSRVWEGEKGLARPLPAHAGCLACPRAAHPSPSARQGRKTHVLAGHLWDQAPCFIEIMLTHPIALGGEASPHFETGA